MKTGEMVLASMGDDREYACEIASIEEDCVRLRIVDVYGSNRELPVAITLFQALPKGDKMETIIQKAVELGAVRIVPVITNRVIVKLDDKKAQKKVLRWNAIAQAAAKQSKRNMVPLVTEPQSFANALDQAADLQGAIIPYENAKGMCAARSTVAEMIKRESLGVFIGPEGGFSAEEIASATAQGVVPITLGHRILRTETAGMAMLSILMFAMEEDS
jgi:16S rRNA (uracil1498-N3)-methyltransferase